MADIFGALVRGGATVDGVDGDHAPIHQARRDADPAPDLDRTAGVVPVRADEHVREHVVSRDDAADRLPEDLSAFEDGAEQLRVRPGLAHTGGRGSGRIAVSASRSSTSTARW